MKTELLFRVSGAIEVIKALHSMQAAPRSCPVTVEIKLCPVSASFLLLSDTLSTSIDPFGAHFLTFSYSYL